SSACGARRSSTELRRFRSLRRSSCGSGEGRGSPRRKARVGGRGMKIPLTTVRDRAFRDDLPRRWAAVRRLMAEEDLRAVVAAAAGAPSQTGWLRYLTGGDLWQDHAY